MLRRFRRVHVPAGRSLLEIGIVEMREEQRIVGQKVRFALDGVVPIELADESHRFLVGQGRRPPFQSAHAGHHRISRHDVHLLVHPHVVVDVRQLVEAEGGHRKEPERDHHVAIDPRLFPVPVGDAVDEFLQRVS